MAELERNKQTVVAFYTRASNDHEPADAVARYGGSQYIQHNPDTPDGAETFVRNTQLMIQRFPGLGVEIKRVIAQGDLVAAHNLVARSPEDGSGKRPLFSIATGFKHTRRLAPLVPSIYTGLQRSPAARRSTDGRHSLTIRWHLPRVGAARVAARARALLVDQRPLGIAQRMFAGCARRLRRYRLDRQNTLHRRPRHPAHSRSHALRRDRCGSALPSRGGLCVARPAAG